MPSIILFVVNIEDIVPVIEKLTNNRLRAHVVRFFSIDSYKEWIKNQIDSKKYVELGKAWDKKDTKGFEKLLKKYGV